MKPSEFYKMRKPEYFSDSEEIYSATLPREVLAYELDKISTNQKQDEFEVLCRRLAEKFVTPNLIPQVGPTGGGDGKTDSETHPVSTYISDRWFIPENGWEKDEKWAFAISAKQAWKSKAKSDIKKIVETKRGYTVVYFMTNQLIPSKKKKDAQDEFKKTFNVEVIILDGEWILEKIYGNNLIDIAVDSLNLSNAYKNRITKVGPNDAVRLKKLEELEKNIINPNRYSDYDFQLIEDCLEVAVLSRMLEKPRDEVEGKFDRALRLCKKNNNPKYRLRIYYQRAWTYFNWYDDYALFIDDYKSLKEHISTSSSIPEIEKYFNLFNLLNSLARSGAYDLSQSAIKIERETDDILGILVEIENDKNRTSSALSARSFRVLIELTNALKCGAPPNTYFMDLADIVAQSSNNLDFAFQSTRQIIEEMGSIFPNDTDFDNLIDKLAEVSEKRSSELAAGDTFVRRGAQKLEAECYKECIVYFGKAVMKLAKEESHTEMLLVLLGLGLAYRELGLIWASNNCYITAFSLSFKSSTDKGTFDKRIIQSLREIVANELILGRIPSFFAWFEVYKILERVHGVDESQDEVPFTQLIDGCLSTRLLQTNNSNSEAFNYLPDLLDSLGLFSAGVSSLYKLGYNDEALKCCEGISGEDELTSFFDTFANQPFVKQMLYDTNFMSEQIISLSSNILGCKFSIILTANVEILLAAETLLALLEGYFASSMGTLIAHTSDISINLKEGEPDSVLTFTYNELSTEYDVFVTDFNVTRENYEVLWVELTKLISDITSRHFASKDFKKYAEDLFQKEEIHERLSLVVNHRNFVLDLLGATPKLFFDNWGDTCAFKEYLPKKNSPMIYKEVQAGDKKSSKESIGGLRHDEIETHSIIDIPLWDKARWEGVGMMLQPETGFLGFLLLFDNSDAGKLIFDKWIKKLGREDKSGLIKITIIKGVDKTHPHWYRVIITTNVDSVDLSPNSKKFIALPSRIHEMNPSSPKTLNDLISFFNILKNYTLFPARFKDGGKGIEPFWDKGISKVTLTVKDAWQVGEDDFDSIAIKDTDNPIIPEGMDNAPVLKLLKRMKSK